MPLFLCVLIAHLKDAHEIILDFPTEADKGNSSDFIDMQAQ